MTHRVPQNTVLAHEDLFDRVVTASPAGIVVVDRQGQIVFANAHAEQILGLTWADLARRTYNAPTWSIADLDGNPMRDEDLPFGQVMRTGREVRDVRHSILWPDGRRVLLSVSGVPLFDADGRPDGMVATVEDITERMQATAALRETEEMLRQILSQMPYPVEVCSPDGTATMVNQAFLDMFGVPSADLVVGKYRVQDDPLVMDELGLGEAIRRVYSGEAVFLPEVTLPRESIGPQYRVGRGGVVFQEATMFPVFKPSGEIWRVVTIWQDITERKAAEADLRRQMRRLQALRQVSLEITTHLEPEAVLQSIVAKSVDLLGAQSGGFYVWRPDLDALEWSVNFGPDLAPLGSRLGRGEGLSGKIWDSGQPLYVEDYATWPGRAAIYDSFDFQSVLGVPVQWAAGSAEAEFLGVLNVMADRPAAFDQADVELLGLLAAQAAVAVKNARLYQAEREQRALAEALRAEMQAAYDNLTRTQGQLVQSAKMAAIGSLVAGVAHELNNPLTSVLGYAELLTWQAEPGSPLAEDLEVILEQGRRARNIVRDLLDFSRQSQMVHRTVELNELLRTAVSLVRHQVLGDQLLVEEIYDDHLPPLTLAAGRIQQVFLNLFSNALLAMPDGGKLTVRTERVGNAVAVHVADSGTGIPPDVLPHVFEPFFTTRPTGKGPGLGLSVSLGIVEEHGGHIDVESQEGVGSTLTVWLPIRRTLGEADDGT